MPSRLRRLWTRWSGRATTRAEQRYVCGDCELVLPPDHKLPEYQRLHPRYDRFLPHLARYVPAGSAVIDVGANCGDTVAAMAAANVALHYLCIEPDPVFHRYLEHNAERIQAAHPGVCIDIVRAMVGRRILSASLEGDGGTKHARPGPGGEMTTTIDRILEGRPLPPVWLLKSDVDGFDFDVLDSAEALITDHQPVLFFECQPLDAAQRAGFAELLPHLAAAGYTRLAVFDNFGELLLRDAQPQQVDELIEYAWRQQQGLATRTFYYCDVLACSARDAVVIDTALASY